MKSTENHSWYILLDIIRPYCSYASYELWYNGKIDGITTKGLLVPPIRVAPESVVTSLAVQHKSYNSLSQIPCQPYVVIKTIRNQLGMITVENKVITEL